jgi:hypothetical protein
MPPGDDFAQVGVALGVFRQQHDMLKGLSRLGELHAENGPDALLPAFQIKQNEPAHAVRVGEGQSRHPELLGARHEFRNGAHARVEGEDRVGVKGSEHDRDGQDERMGEDDYLRNSLLNSSLVAPKLSRSPTWRS